MRRQPSDHLLSVLGLLAVAGLVAPLVGLLAHLEPAALAAQLASPAVVDALTLSLVVSSAAVLLALALGLPLAYLLARVELPGKALLRGLVALPMVLPPVVGGLALLVTFGRRGLFGELLGALGISLPFTTAGAIVAVAFVAAPFLILSLEAGLLAIDPRLEAAAATLGAGRLRVLWTITLPLLRPALASGIALAWARALGEFGATITFAGNLAGRTRTMPLAIYTALQVDPPAAVALGVLLLGLALVVLVALRGRLLPGERHGGRE
ncbi:MAG: molybdate ABC transporter permease subunit [Myxococcales bacterium]|nr:molybdate ABC transporter permease subunit [Myxococcales bacterium]MCB9706058.1 molybdate ABC transporter permease subunit [Myxococcales bacterium]